MSEESEEKDLLTFFHFFCDCLDEIDSIYYETVYSSVDYLRQVLANKGAFNDEGDFTRYGERIFAYELYHQLRCTLEQQSPDFLNGSKLQGEIKKCHMNGLATHLSLEDLEKDYIPDFIVHTPTLGDYHAFIIEIKCLWNDSKANEKKNIGDVWDDLYKINQFITNFEYKRGIFLAINTNPNLLKSIIEKLTNGYEIGEGEIIQIDDLDNINQSEIICKPRHNGPTFIWNWEKYEWLTYKAS